MKKRFKLFFILFFIGIGVSFAQIRVTGSVKDENGEPIWKDTYFYSLASTGQV